MSAAWLANQCKAFSLSFVKFAKVTLKTDFLRLALPPLLPLVRRQAAVVALLAVSSPLLSDQHVPPPLLWSEPLLLAYGSLGFCKVRALRLSGRAGYSPATPRPEIVARFTALNPPSSVGRVTV